jgi:hypothetical protein
MVKGGMPWEQLRPSLWNVKLNHDANLLVAIAGPVLVYRIKVMDVPAQDKRGDLYEALLRLNAAEMVHGAFGLEGDAVVITDALELENLDYNEFQAAVDEIALAVSKQYPILSKFQAGGDTNRVRTSA